MTFLGVMLGAFVGWVMWTPKGFGRWLAEVRYSYEQWFAKGCKK